MERKRFSPRIRPFMGDACRYTSCARPCPGLPRAPPSLYIEYRNADPLGRVTGHDSRGRDMEGHHPPLADPGPITCNRARRAAAL